jgi:glycogen debranching enzyme
MTNDVVTTATRWTARARSYLDELQTPSGLRASSAEGRFHAVFGRDTLWSVLLVLEAASLRPSDVDLNAWALDMARRSLQALARHQGRRVDDQNEEQPGKIVHEYWPDPPRHLLEHGWPMVDGRYYGSVDATYLFLMAGVKLWQMGPPGRALVTELWAPLRAALDWALISGDADGDGLVEVAPHQAQGRGLTNQVWKDSGDSLQLPDRSIPQPPVAWLELQGYALAAFRGMSAILAEQGAEPELRAELGQRAGRVEAGLERFWLADEGCPAMALTREKQPIPLVSSNIGHLLWCDGLTGAHAAEAAARLTQPDLLSTWGLRTLSSASYAFNPGAYHLGSIWPFDNAIAAGALWRMGWHDDARGIGRRVLAALDVSDSPVELYCALPSEWAAAPGSADDVLYEYVERGHVQGTRVQAWTCAGVLVFAAHALAEPGATSAL